MGTSHQPKHRTSKPGNYQILDQAAEQVAFPQRGPSGKLMTWSWKLNDELRGGLTTHQPVLADRSGFIRYHLIRLGIGHDLQAIRGGGTRRPIAPAHEVLALCPELGPAD